MKLIFNDGTEMPVQKVDSRGDYLKIISLEKPEVLYEYMSNPDKTRIMIAEERGNQVPYKGYTQFYRTETYTGGIYGIVNYKPDKTPEVQAEVQAAAVMVAQIQAQALEDEQALSVQAIYPSWNGASVNYAAGYKVRHNGALYKCLQAHMSQAGWEPGTAPSLWAAIAGEQAGTIDSPIQVPDEVSTSGMEYECGKYYYESGVAYLMDRQGMSPGDKVILYFPPSALEGQYFTVIK